MSSLPRGLLIYQNFLSLAESQRMLEFVNECDGWFPVSPSPKAREVLHFGYSYKYTHHSLERAAEIPADLVPARPLAEDFTPDQLIVNRYKPGQGISAHVDRIDVFGSTIACITLGSGAEMEFTCPGHPSFTVYLDVGSLLVMTDEVRYLYAHRIPSRRTDLVCGKRVKRGTRVSLTYRTVRSPPIPVIHVE